MTRPPAAVVPADPVANLNLALDKSGLPFGPSLKRAGRKLGLYSVRDLLFHLPRRYDDLREMRKLVDLVWADEGTVVSAKVRVKELRVQPGFRRRVQRTVATLTDDTGSIEATWFGRRYIEDRLQVGHEVIVSGKLKRFGRKSSIDNPDFQRVTPDVDLLHVGRIVPVYRLSKGMTSARLRSAIREALNREASKYPEYLPEAARKDKSLPPIGQALEEAHFPSGLPEKDAALRRFAFDELLALQIGMVARRRQRGRGAAQPIRLEAAQDTALRSALETSLSRSLSRPTKLTADQVSATRALSEDLAKSTPMLRLLQGDVGSGKTAVAAWALGAAAKAGLQGALLAPTDLLARQHHATLSDLLEDAGIPVTLLTGSLSGQGTKSALEALRSGQANVVVGTHALIQGRVKFSALGLVVIDEQHRFGVEQRGQLEAKSGEHAPHVLLMTATPIPRTLGQVLYADLDVSDLRTPPEGRLRIGTGIRHPSQLKDLWDLVVQQARAGHATFVVVPAIDDSEDEGVVAAKSEHKRLQTLLSDLKVGLVHGQMKAVDRDRELSRLRDRELDVLVGTTVLEVGVDVPRATLMIVEAADRFGLAQLHQLRGRVGRGDVRSYCALVSDAAPNNETWEDLRFARRAPETTEQARLVAVARTADGFVLAEKDWELRKEGDVLGLTQSGLPRLRIASLQDREHQVLAKDARSLAEQLLDQSGRLQPGFDTLDHELSRGWLARVFAGDPGGSA